MRRVAGASMDAAPLPRSGRALSRRCVVRSPGPRRERARHEACLQLRQLAELRDAGLPHARQREAFAHTVSMRVGAPQPQEFTLCLRIPGWASGARIEVNGQRWSGATEPGSFAAVTRRWCDGDRLDLEFPRRLRLESVDRLCGPLVLFAISAGSERPRPRRTELLATRQVAQRRYENGPPARTTAPADQAESVEQSLGRRGCS